MMGGASVFYEKTVTQDGHWGGKGQGILYFSSMSGNSQGILQNGQRNFKCQESQGKPTGNSQIWAKLFAVGGIYPF